MSIDRSIADRAPDPSRFEDRILFVTGASSGIGRATAIRLAAEGACLYLTDPGGDGLKDTAERCAEQGADVVTHILDVSDVTSVTEAINTCVSSFGRLDCLCNAADVVVVEHLEKTTVEQFRSLVDVNLLGTFLTTRAAIPYLIETGGNIVNLSSTVAVEGAGLMAAYGATKGGVSALSRGIAAEFGARGVRCNTIISGRMSSPAQAEGRTPASVDLSISGRYPLIPVAPPLARIAAVIAMVASDDGAYLNGTEIRVDGGWAPH